MARFGFIHDPLEIKILILFLLNRLPSSVDFSRLTELVLCDDAIDYFDFTQSLSELIASGHVIEHDGLYSSTDKGRRNGETTESSLPFSVRKKAEIAAISLSRSMQRDSMIYTSSEQLEGGGYLVSLSLSDKLGKLLSVELLSGSNEQAALIEKNFRKHAEDFCDKITLLLLNED